MTREEALNESVSRDKAIVQLNHLLSDWDDDWNIAIRKCIETIKILPSVTPPPCDDSVSRQDVEDAIYDYSRSCDVNYAQIMEFIDKLPSVTPQPCDDAVSRKAVLDLPRIKTHNVWGNVIYKSVDVDAVRQLPSVTPQPKVGRWNFTKHYGRYYYVCSACGMERMDDHSSGWNYCPFCGCKMQEVKDES